MAAMKNEVKIEIIKATAEITKAAFGTGSHITHTELVAKFIDTVYTKLEEKCLDKAS